MPRDSSRAVVLGLNGRSRTGTLHDALVFLDEQGERVGRRRELVLDTTGHGARTDLFRLAARANRRSPER